jgi:type IV pilus assembly protein PilC
VSIGVVFNRWVHTPSGKYLFDAILLKVPIVGKIITGSTLTNFTRTFGLLTTAGVPLLDSLNIVTDVIGNSVYKKAFQDTFRGVERGLAFSAQLELVGIFPKIIPQMYRVGEETGKVDKVSFKMAEYFETETDNLVKNITVLIEPIVIVVLGVGVGFLVLSIILPIYKLTTSYS